MSRIGVTLCGPSVKCSTQAIVIVPSDEDYKARIEAQEKEETKDVPDNAVMEMKGIAKEKLTFCIVTLSSESGNGVFESNLEPNKFTINR